jgi:hypothetical protein
VAEITRPPYDFLSDPLIFIILAIFTPIANMLGFLTGNSLFLLIVDTVVIFPFFLLAIRRGRLQRAIGFTLVWSVIQAISVIVLTGAVPQQAEFSIAQGIEYHAEMTQWIATGQSSVNTPTAFLPAQGRSLALLVVATVLTGGFGGLLMIASQINYTGFYIAHLISHAVNPLLLAVSAWPLWNLVNVAGFLICCAVLAEPLLCWNRRAPMKRLPLLAMGLSLIVLDTILRLLLAPVWRDLLRQATNLG